MRSWRINIVVVLFALGSLPATTAQSLGDVARAERERRSKMPHHARVLSEEDLSRDKILQTVPSDADFQVRPSDNIAPVSDDLPLGDYARTLRQRQAVKQASAPTPAAKPAIASGSNPAAPTPLPRPGVAEPDHKTTSLGDAKQARTGRDAARPAQTRNRPSQLARQGANDASRAEAARRLPETSHTVPGAPASPKLARSPEARSTPSAADRRTQPPALLEPGVMENGQVESIRVPRGGSLWQLAREYLGAGRLWVALWKANPQIKDPNRIRAGQLLRCPVLRNGEPTDSFRSAGLKRPNGAAVSPTGPDAATVPATGKAGRLMPTRTGIRPNEQLRKSLLSRALSR